MRYQAVLYPRFYMDADNDEIAAVKDPGKQTVYKLDDKGKSVNFYLQ